MVIARKLEQMAQLAQGRGAKLTLEHLVEADADRLPRPGAGQTLERWRALSEVAAHDLSLVKLFEGHTDALAILSELDGPASALRARWGTWCAEPPDARVSMAPKAGAGRLTGERVVLNGTKAWCSGAAQVTHAVVSCWNEEGEPCLAAVAMAQPGVSVTHEGWEAVGMAASGSVDVRFEGAEAIQLGSAGAYVRRAGFWQGGAGIAACWFGGAAGIARRVRERTGPTADAHRLAHLGAIDVALAGAGAVLREAAAWIDAHPKDDARRIALVARLAVEAAADRVIWHAGRAVGAGPLCRDASFARAMADLPVFLRQSHAERDLAALGGCVRDPEGEREGEPWTL